VILIHQSICNPKGIKPMNRFVFSGLLTVTVLGLGAIAACQSPPAAEVPSEAPAETTAETAPETTAEAPAAPASEPAEVASALRSGTFVPGEHNTIGTAELIEESGSFVITFSDDFQTIDNAPDPVIVLHTSTDVIGSTEPPTFPLQEGDYVLIAPLQSPSGAQSYPIPPEIDPTDYGSVVVWCREFNATFAAAPLQ
jgi:hypothetical protein